ncbi:MAG: hypothetical protein ACKO1X_07680 [Acidimicrobiales bacterium]
MTSIDLSPTGPIRFAGIADTNHRDGTIRPSRLPAWALAAIWLYIAVYPANLYMAWDWRDKPFSDQVVSYGRLPFQFLFMWLAWKIAQANDNAEKPVVPGDVV